MPPTSTHPDRWPAVDACARERDYHREQARQWQRLANTQRPPGSPDAALREARYHKTQGDHWEQIRRWVEQRRKRGTRNGTDCD